jgi:hypothetical protein
MARSVATGALGLGELAGDLLCRRGAGCDVAETVTSKRDLAKVQAQVNAWAKETGLAFVHLSRICALSIGENYDPATLMRYAGGEE